MPRSRSHVAIGMMALVLAFKLSRRDPLADGQVPAAAREPHEHWHFLNDSPTIVRDLTAGARKPFWKRLLKMKEMFEEIEDADYGGEDGHEAEDMDDGVGEGARIGTRDMHMLTETMRVTRCATTSSALAGYFCGRSVQHNQDRHSATRKGYFGGSGHEAIVPLNSTLAIHHAEGERALAAGTGAHRRLVYRIGVAPEDGAAGYAHVWTVVALPTGRFYWLQSFIGHYSLHSWMRKLEREHGVAEAARGLSLETLQRKLTTLASLFRFDRWDEAANTAYESLFNVDMFRARGKRDALTKREKVEHQRLGSFQWDVACEFPTPTAPLVADFDPRAALAATDLLRLLRQAKAQRADRLAGLRESRGRRHDENDEDDEDNYDEDDDNDEDQAGMEARAVEEAEEMESWLNEMIHELEDANDVEEYEQVLQQLSARARGRD